MMNLYANGTSTWHIALRDFLQSVRMLFNTPWNINKANFLILLIFTTSTLQAKNPTIPDEVVKHIENPILSGQGRLSFLFFHIYDAALWVERIPWNFEQNFSLTIDYNRGLSKEEIINSSIEEMQRYYPIKNQEKMYREILENIFTDVTSGDRISALYNPQKGLEFLCLLKDT